MATLSYPNTNVTTLVMETSDHVPYLVNISTDIPKGCIFRFKKNWLQHDDFVNQVHLAWDYPVHCTDTAKSLTAKFKNVIKVLKDWKQTLSSLMKNINNFKLVRSFMNLLEEFRDLSIIEWNFKKLLESKLITLLQQQKAYWKQRGNIGG